MRAFLITMCLVGCNGSVIGATPIDAAPDATALDCPTYCAEIEANCTDTNAQYANTATCNSACKTFDAATGGPKVYAKKGEDAGYAANFEMRINEWKDFSVKGAGAAATESEDEQGSGDNQNFPL